MWISGISRLYTPLTESSSTLGSEEKQVLKKTVKQSSELLCTHSLSLPQKEMTHMSNKKKKIPQNP